MSSKRHELLARTGEYYSNKLRQQGPTPRGVDWRDAEGQGLRFAQLIGITRGDKTGSLAELGCGYGALLDWLRDRGYAMSYTGYDVSPEMVEAASSRLQHLPDVALRVGSTLAEPADYVISSGIFNVRLDYDDETWLAHVVETIEQMAAVARIGFAFNCLTSHSDAERMQTHLFYVDPAWMLTHCIKQYGRDVALRHDYGLFEFTMLVWKRI
jgi:SAM-dependent methyltransferase